MKMRLGSVMVMVVYGLLTTGAVGALIAIVWWGRRLQTKRNVAVEGRRCLCGYLAIGLEIPRCPECGRMIGFDKSPEELGVSEEQMRAEAERRKTTRGSATIS